MPQQSSQGVQYHEAYAVSYRPLEWSDSLADEAHAKAEDLAAICNTTNAGVGLKYGMNAQWTTIGGNNPTLLLLRIVFIVGWKSITSAIQIMERPLKLYGGRLTG